MDAGQHALGYPRINIIAKMNMGSRSTAALIDEVSDAERMQMIVNKMPQDLRAVFEACHLGLIHEASYIKLSHSKRADKLGMPVRTYWRRVDSGKKFASDLLDQWHSFC